MTWEYRSPDQWRSQRPWRSSPTAAFFSGAADLASFGFGDELKGLVFGRRARDEARERQEMHRQQNLGWFTAGQIAGGFAGAAPLSMLWRGALGGSRLMGNLNWVGRAGVMGAMGGTGTAAYGAGTARTDSERLGAAARNFVPGVIAGAGLSALGSAIGPHVSRWWNGRSPEASSVDLLGQGLAREGLSEQAFRARLAQHAAMGRGGMVLDTLGESGSHLTMGAANRPSAGRTALRDALEARNMAMGPRAQDEIGAAFMGPGQKNAVERLKELQQIQRTQAGPMYEDAWQSIGRLNPAQVESAVGETIRRHPALFGPARAHAQRLSLSETGKELGDPADPRYWHYMLQGVQRELGARLRAGYMGELRGYQGAEIAMYTRAAQQFNAQIRRLLGPKFRAAQDTYSGAASAQDAVEMGYMAFAPKLNSLQLENIMTRFARMRPGDQAQFRAAFAHRLQDELSAANTLNGKIDVLRSIMGSEGKRRLLQRVLGEKQTQALLRNFDYDRRLFQTGVETGIRTNSHTAPILAAERSIADATAAPVSTPGGIMERLLGPQLRRAAEARSEATSNALLAIMAMPADVAHSQLARAPLARWGVQRGLLARASDRAKAIREFRQRRTLDALSYGPYIGLGGEALGEQQGVW